MSDCDFCSGEGYCIADDEFKCSFAKGNWKECTAKEDDLVEGCEMCSINPASGKGVYPELCEGCTKEREKEIADGD